MINQLWYIKSY